MANALKRRGSLTIWVDPVMTWVAEPTGSGVDNPSTAMLPSHLPENEGPGQAFVTADTFPLEQLEEAFRDRIVMAVSAAAHAGIQIVLAQEQLPLAAGELRSLSEWIITLVLGLRRQTAASKACRARSVVLRGCADQPTTRRENRSMTTERPSQPSCILM